MSVDILIKEQRDLLNLINKLVERFNQKNRSEKTCGYLTSLSQRVDDIFTKFDSQHDRIVHLIHEESINANDVPYLKDDVYMDFSETYLTFKGKILDSLPEHSPVNGPMTSTFAAPNNRSDTTINPDTRLLKISIPKFSGEYMEWIPFRNIYISLVYHNDSLNKVQKFYYLKEKQHNMLDTKISKL